MKTAITGVILAGGQGSRMGGIDKGLMAINKSPIIDIIIQQLSAQVSDIAINANRNIEQYKTFSDHVFSDQAEGFQGPLAGVYAALCYSHNEWIVTVPCDSPFIAKDYVKSMADAIDNKQKIVVARNRERLQPTYLLVHKSLANDLKQFLDNGERKIDLWLQRHAHAIVTFPEQEKMFVNLNRPEDMERLN